MCFRRLMLAALLLSGIMAACASNAVRNCYVRENYDLSYIKRVAVLPFGNLSNDKAAGERLRNMFACELLASGLVDVASSGETSAAFDKLRMDSPAMMKAEDFKSTCQAVGAQAVIYGTVSHLEEVKAGQLSVPEVAVTFTMVDDSGVTIWTSNTVTSGGGFWSNYLGGRGESVTEVSLRAIRNAIKTLHH